MTHRRGHAKEQRLWTHGEELFLRKRWRRHTDPQLADKLDRTAWSVRNKRHRLGLKARKGGWKDIKSHL